MGRLRGRFRRLFLLRSWGVGCGLLVGSVLASCSVDSVGMGIRFCVIFFRSD